MFENNNKNDRHWLSSVIISLAHRHKIKKNIKQIYANNNERRNIIEYQPCQLEDFFNPQEALGGLVVSGGNNELRLKAIVTMAICAYNKGIPVVFIHENNSMLEGMLQQTFMTTNNCHILNQVNDIYDPFVGLSDEQIHNFVIKSASNEHQIKADGKYYLDGISRFIRSKKIQPYC